MSSMKQDFPLLQNQPDLVYLDNAATTQMPQVVIDRLDHYTRYEHANIHRGLYDLSATNTAHYEATRQVVKDFLSADATYETIFTSGATFGLNWTAVGLKPLLTDKDTILIGRDSHHSNIVPWQQVAQETGAKLAFIPINDQGLINLAELEELLPNTAVIALSHVSNVTGVIHPVAAICRLANKHSCLTVIDGAQALHHFPVSLTEIDCDLYVFSAHKVYGPTGVGAVVGKKSVLAKMQPLLYGGNMIDSVSEKNATLAAVPSRFEAGTPPLAQVIGMNAALTWLQEQDRVQLWHEEQAIIRYALAKLAAITEVTLIGPVDYQQRAGVIAFTVTDTHPHDLAQILSDHHVAVRAGHHCAQLIHRFFNTAASLRISFAMYTERSDIDTFCEHLKKAIKQLHV